MTEDNLPDLASQQIEEKMEELDLPESDRDEIRRMAEFLRWRHDNKEALEAARKGGPKVPIDPALKKWLLGEDQA